MSLTTDYRTLINRGRKAGLSTRELYLAMSARPSEGSDVLGQADTNGYVQGINARGQSVFRQLDSEERS